MDGYALVCNHRQVTVEVRYEPRNGDKANELYLVIEQVKIVEESFVHMRKVEDLHPFVLICRPASSSLLQFLGSTKHLL